MATRDSTDVSRIDVAYVAALARLPLSPDELRTFQPQLEQIVGYVNTIRQLDLAGVEPTAHPIPLENVFRADVVTPSLDRDLVLRNAPRHAQDQFIVPKIVE